MSSENSSGQRPVFNGVGGNRNKHPISAYSIDRRDVVKIVLFLTGVAISCLAVSKMASNPLQRKLDGPSAALWSPLPPSERSFETKKPKSELERVLTNAAMENKTVIITALNQAWAEPNSTFDLFLESFRVGQGTQRLLKHVVAACLDHKAYIRCQEIHPHCYLLNTTGDDDLSGQNTFMTPGYLKLIWRRMEFLRQVLQMGYNFIFTDADILWFRDPFPRLYPNVEFQMACDHFFGDPNDIDNWVNSGFTYVKSNNKTIQFYKFWCNSSLTYPNMHDQDVFNMIKHDPAIAEIGIDMRFLDTVYFGGFCQPSRDINVVCTMHANCCIGLDNKLNDLRLVLEDWGKYLSENTTVANTTWSIPAKCG